MGIVFTVLLSLPSAFATVRNTPECERLLRDLDGDYLKNRDFLNARLPLLGFGGFAHVYRFENADRSTVSLKLYEGAQAPHDQRALDFYRAISVPEDEVRIARSMVARPHVMLLEDTHGRNLTAHLIEQISPETDARDLVDRYSAYTGRLSQRLHLRFGPDVRLNWHRDSNPTHLSASFILDEERMLLIPHGENVIVEDDTRELVLIDPR